MKKKIILSSILALGVLGGVVGVANRSIRVEAANIAANTYVYFELPSNWDKTKNVNFMIGHNSWSQGYNMTNIANTDIYYVKMPQWDGYTEYAFFSVDGTWGGEGSKLSNRKSWAYNSTNIMSASGDYVLNSGKCTLFGGEALAPYITKGNAYTNLNLSISVKAPEGIDVSVTGYELTSASAVTQNTGTSINVLKYTDVTLTAPTKEGYEFIGWYDDETGGTLLSNELTHPITDVYEAKTYYARYNQTVVIPETPADLFVEFYNEGTYTKETTLYTNKLADEELATHFHAGAQTKHRKTTYAPGELTMVTKEKEADEWGKHTSTYKDNKEGGVDHLTNGEFDYHVSGKVNGQDRSSVENWYVTLFDFVNTELTGWEYADGVYSLSLKDNATARKMAIEFVAPMFLDNENTNYVTYDKLTVEKVDDSLVMKIHLVKDSEGLLTGEEGLVLSKAVITK